MTLGYIGGVEDTPPATLQQMAELITSCIKGVGQTVPTNWVHVPRIDLAGPFPWYKTVAGTADPTEESPGQVVITGSLTEAYIAEYRGVFEFKTSVNSANTPLNAKYRALMREERLRLMAERERDSILKVLSITGQKMPP